MALFAEVLLRVVQETLCPPSPPEKKTPRVETFATDPAPQFNEIKPCRNSEHTTSAPRHNPLFQLRSCSVAWCWFSCCCTWASKTPFLRNCFKCTAWNGNDLIRTMCSASYTPVKNQVSTMGVLEAAMELRGSPFACASRSHSRNFDLDSDSWLFLRHMQVPMTFTQNLLDNEIVSNICSKFRKKKQQLESKFHALNRGSTCVWHGVLNRARLRFLQSNRSPERAATPCCGSFDVFMCFHSCISCYCMTVVHLFHLVLLHISLQNSVNWWWVKRLMFFDAPNWEKWIYCHHCFCGLVKSVLWISHIWFEMISTVCSIHYTHTTQTCWEGMLF